MVDFLAVSMTLSLGCLLGYPTLTAAENLRTSDIQYLVEVLENVADTRTTDIISQLVQSAAKDPNSAQLLADAYKALNSASTTPSTETSTKDTSIQTEPTTSREPPLTVTSTTTSVAAITTTTPITTTITTTTSTITTTTTTHPDVETSSSAKTTTAAAYSTSESGQSSHSTATRSPDGSVAAARKKYEDLAQQMKTDADELVGILRNNTATVVSELIGIAQALEKDIRDKSIALEQSVYMSSNELRDDNIMLVDAMEHA